MARALTLDVNNTTERKYSITLSLAAHDDNTLFWWTISKVKCSFKEDFFLSVSLSLATIVYVIHFVQLYPLTLVVNKATERRYSISFSLCCA